MIGILFSLFTTLVTGYIFIDIFFQCKSLVCCHRLIKISLGFGAGLGLMSLVSFLLLFIFHQLNLPIVLMGDVLIMTFVVCLNRMVKAKNLQPSVCRVLLQTSIPQASTSLTSVLFIATIIMLYCALLLFFFWSSSLPHGAWDAWSIWNANARFIFRGGTVWKQALSSVLLGSSTDYPWMYPVVIARLWFYTGKDVTIVPIIISAIYMFGTALLLGSCLLVLRGKQQALLAVIVLLATPFFILHSASQMADIPLGYYFLATMVCWQLFLHYSSSTSHMNASFLFLTGLFAGLSMFMKNEGIFFIIMLSINYFITSNRWQMYRFFLLGIAPFVAMNIWTRIVFMKPALATGSFSSPYLSRLFDFSRHEIALSAFWFVGKTFGQFAIPIWLLLCLYLCVTGIKLPRDVFYQTLTILWQILLMLVGYYAIYIFISPDIVWHIKSSLDRLYLQLWPTFLLFYFLLVGELKNTKQHNNQNNKHQNIR